MTNPTIAEIAGKLTAAQKAAIKRFQSGMRLTPALLVYPDLAREHYLPFRLAEPCLFGETAEDKMERLTPLGEAVRAYLQEQER